MSWSQWPQTTGAVPGWTGTNIAPTPAAVAPLQTPGTPYTPEQWAAMQQQNWQQWVQWQQQYQQWQQQYGEQYQKSLALAGQTPAALPLMPVQPPLPVTENKSVPPLPMDVRPPLPPEEPPKIAPTAMPLMNFNTSVPPPNVTSLPPNQLPPPQQQQQQSPQKQPLLQIGQQQQNYTQNRFNNTSNPPPSLLSLPISKPTFINQQPNRNQSFTNKRSGDFHDTDDAKKNCWEGSIQQDKQWNQPKNQQWAASKPAAQRPNVEELSEAEKNFDKQFEQWEAQFNKWKEQNAGHPDKQQYKEYEAKWESWRTQLLDRREQMRKKRLGLLGSPVQTTPSTKTNIAAPPFGTMPPPNVAPTVKQPETEIKKEVPKLTINKSKEEVPEKKIEKKEVIDKNISALLSQPPKEQRANIRQRRASVKSEPENITDTSFLKANVETEGGIPGLDLVTDDTKLPDNKEEKKQDAPDYEAISKGINSILGDKNLLSMLSMVAQNKKIEPPVEAQTPSLQTNDSFGNQVPEEQQNKNDFDERRNQPQNEFNNFGQQDFDADNRNKFGMQNRPQNDFNQFNRGPNNFGQGQNFNQGNFNKNSDFNSSNRGGNFNQDSSFRGNFNQNSNRNPGGFNQAPNRNPGGFNQAPNRNPGGFNQPPPANMNSGGFQFRGPGAFNQNPRNRGPNNFDRGFQNENRFNRDFNQNSQNMDETAQNKMDNDFQQNFEDLDRHSNDFDFNQQQNNFNRRSGDFNQPANQRQTNRDAGDFNQGPGNFNQAQFNKGPTNFNQGPNKNFGGFNEGEMNRNQNDFTPNRGFNKNCDDFNRGPGNFNKGPPNFNKGPPNRGPNDFNKGPPNRGPNDFNKGPPNRDFNRPGDFNRPDDFNRGSGDFNRGSNDFNRRSGDFNRGSGDFNRGPGDFNRGSGDYNQGPRNRGRDFNPTNFNQGPNEFNENNFDEGSNWDQENDVSNIEAEENDPSCMEDSINIHGDHDMRDRPEINEEVVAESENSNQVPSGKYWDEALILKPVTVIDYEHKSINKAESTFMEPVQTFDYGHTSKNVDNKIRDIPPKFQRYKDPAPKFRHEYSPKPQNTKFEHRDFRRSYNNREELFPKSKSFDEKEQYEGVDDYEDDPFEEPEFNRRSNERELEPFLNKPNPATFDDSLTKPKEKSVIMIEDLLTPPGRDSRPPRIVIILRGPPGSGKTFLAKLIKDKEVEQGGCAPRILSLDDYFMVEQDKEVFDQESGRKTTVKEMVYEYEECMELAYRKSLEKAFKKTITDGFFPFIILDCVNDKTKYFSEMWSFAKQHGFQVYICQMELDVTACTKRNIHHRSEIEIEHLVSGWETTPAHYLTLDASSLIQSSCISEVEMEEVIEIDDDKDDEDAEGHVISKWERMEHSGEKLARLDGTSKPLRPRATMEDYLQVDEEVIQEDKPGQKRVRWADLEERRRQDKMRAIGFVVGQTDWGRMMDPTQGGSALTQTKYIERVRRF